MSYRIEKLAGEPLIIVSGDPASHSPSEAQAFVRELQQTLDAQTEQVFLVLMLPDNYRYTVNDLIDGAQMFRKQSELYHHKNVRALLAVTTDKTLKAAYQGLSREVFGGIEIAAFDTLEEALAFARS